MNSKIPNIAGNTTYEEFDKDAQDAFVTKWTITQDGVKVKIHRSLYDPYDRKTSQFAINGEIVAFSKKLKIVKIKSTENKLYWLYYDKLDFINPVPEQIFYLRNKKIKPNLETLNTLANFFSIAVSMITGKKYEFNFKKFSDYQYSNEIDGFKILFQYQKGYNDYDMQLIAPDEFLPHIKLGIFSDKKRNGFINIIAVSFNFVDIIFKKYRKFLEQTNIIEEW